MFHSLYNRSAETGALLTDPATRERDAMFPGWPAAYMAPETDAAPDVFDPEHWQVEIGGLVTRPLTLSLREMAGFTRIQQNRRLVFADGYSYRASWEGFVVQELLHRAAPLPEAQYLIQTDRAGRRECMTLRDLFNQRALFCLRTEGKPLPALYGGPIRLLVFDRYAHKGLGQITRLELAGEPIEGFYAGKGYDPEGRIEPGDYYAADLQSMQNIRETGEVTQW